MDNLQILFLALLLQITNSKITLLCLCSMIFMKYINLTQFTSFLTLCLTTYTFYGFSGVIYMLFSTLTTFLIVLSYWCNLNSVNYLEKYNDLGFNKNNVDINNKLAVVEEYRNNVIEYVYLKLKLTEDKRDKISDLYNTACHNLDVLIDKLYRDLCKLVLYIRRKTNHIDTLNNMYNYYDKCIELKYKFNNLCNNNYFNEDKYKNRIPINDRTILDEDIDNYINADKNNNIIPNLDMNEEKLNDLLGINSMTREQKENIDRMTNELMKGMNFESLLKGI